MEGQEGLAVGPEQHQIGLPMAGGLARGDLVRSLGQGAALGDAEGGATPFPPSPAALGFGLGQVVPPRVVFCAGDLGINKAIDRFVRNAWLGGRLGKAASYLLRGPALLKPG